MSMKALTKIEVPRCVCGRGSTGMISWYVGEGIIGLVLLLLHRAQRH